MLSGKIQGAIFGFAVGDALGVPVEFMDREVLRKNPVTDMREFGTHNQPMGTWSDDTSMTLATIESLSGGFDVEDMMNKFSDWLNEGYMSATGVVFDVGIGTCSALKKFKNGVPALSCGGSDEFDNGNGSLMRILPIAFYTFEMSFEERVKIIEDVCMLTHGHVRSHIGCCIYVQFAIELLKGNPKEKAIRKAIKKVSDYYEDEAELKSYKRIIDGEVFLLSEDEISSSGYVVHTLEAVLWVLFSTDNYRDCVLAAVNLGSDTDTVGAIVGGLAGICYGMKSIPESWVNVVAKADEIKRICSDFADSLSKTQKSRRSF